MSPTALETRLKSKRGRGPAKVFFPEGRSVFARVPLPKTDEYLPKDIAWPILKLRHKLWKIKEEGKGRGLEKGGRGAS